MRWEMRGGSDLWLRRRSCHFCFESANHSRICGCNDFPIMRGEGGEVRGVIQHRATSDDRHVKMKEKNKKNECVCSQWDVYALREQWSKTRSLNPKQNPPSTNTHTTHFSIQTIYKHYLYFVHTLVHAHTQIHSELLFAEWLSLSRFTSSRMAFVVIIENLWFSPLISWSIKGTAHGPDFHFNDDLIVETANLCIPHHPACHVSRGPTCASFR